MGNTFAEQDILFLRTDVMGCHCEGALCSVPLEVHPLEEQAGQWIIPKQLVLSIQYRRNGLTEVHTWRNILYALKDFEDIKLCVLYSGDISVPFIVALNLPE